jgi:putative membrane protein
VGTLYGGGYGGYGPPAGRPRRWLAIGIALVTVAVIGVVLLFYVNGYFGPTPYGPHPFLGFWGGFFLLFILLWITFFIVRVAFWSSRGARGYRRGHWGPDPAVMVARQRYARGEITREQFDQIMTDLGRRGRGPGGPLSGA